MKITSSFGIYKIIIVVIYRFLESDNEKALKPRATLLTLK